MTRHRSRASQRRNQRLWQAHVKALERSGLNRAEYCRRHELSYHALTYWQRKLSARPGPGTTLVPVSFKQMRQESAQSKGSGLTIVVTDKLSIEVGDHFLPITLNRVPSVLESR